MNCRVLLSGAAVAAVAMLTSVESGSAWPRVVELDAAFHDLILPAQMGGMGGMGGGGMAGMAGGGMAGGGMAGGGMAGAGGMAGGMGAAAGMGGGGMGAGMGGKAAAGMGGGGKGGGGKGAAGMGGGGKGGGGKAAAGMGGGSKTTNINRTTNVNVSGSVRPWVTRPYYGTIVGGVALGSVILATTPRVVPVAPAANMCWLWSDSLQTSGYWDYCTPP